MSYFNKSRGIELEENDLNYQTPEFVKNFNDFIMGKDFKMKKSPEKKCPKCKRIRAHREDIEWIELYGECLTCDKINLELYDE